MTAVVNRGSIVRVWSYWKPDAEGAVIGVPGETWGETHVALIGPMPGAGLDPAAVVTACREQPADHERPRFVVIGDEPLPRRLSGQVLERNLRDDYADRARLGPALS